MTREEYIHAAELIREYYATRPIEERTRVVDLFVEFFTDDNSRFDEPKFREVCNND
jgi:hypothetical protein